MFLTKKSSKPEKVGGSKKLSKFIKSEYKY